MNSASGKAPSPWLFPTAAQRLPRVVNAAGARLYDEEGRDYLDGSSGAIAASLGHGNAELVERIAEQGLAVGFAHRTQFRSSVPERLAELIAASAPGDLGVSLLLSSGSDAIEAAMKLTLRHWQLAGEGQKTHFVSRYMSYHGSTLGSSSATGHPARRGAAAALLHDFPGVREPQPEGCLRCLRECTGECADDIEATILRLGPDRIAGFIAEPIGGSSAGVLVPGPGYYERVREICDKHGIWWIADEVMTGVGRTGRWWAIEHWNAVPDVLVSGKGIGGGYMPLSAVTVRSPAAEALIAADGFVPFGNTFTNIPLAAAAGAATFEIIERDGLVGRAAELGALLGERLAQLDGIGGLAVRVRGRGLFWGVEIRDPDSRAPYPPALDVVRRLIDACRANGLIVFRSARHLPGVGGDTILFAPPLTVTDDELEEMLDRLERAIVALGATMEKDLEPTP